MDKPTRFGIVQGRLTQSLSHSLQWFPQDFWEDEFKTAADHGIDFIELIAERHHNSNNPLWSEEGLIKIHKLVAANKLTLHSLCNDFIINHSLLDDKVIEQNISLISQGKKLGIEKYIMPLFENSELNSLNMKEYINSIRSVANVAYKNNMLTCLETILTGKELLKLLKLINLPYVKVVFDTGNRAAFGHDLPNDIRILGDAISHIHIKDKNSDNINTHLGTGLVNFEQVFYAINEINYDGPFTFETVRGRDPIKTVIYNMQVIEFFKKNSESNV